MEMDTNKKEYTIDASGKKLGRLASQIATILMGKNGADFTRNTLSGNKVKVLNSSKIEVTNKKLDSKNYKNYSGYPGGLKVLAMKKVVEDKGFKEALRIAVKGMLPKNKLRDRMMKNLIISE